MCTHPVDTKEGLDVDKHFDTIWLSYVIEKKLEDVYYSKL
jgi:hypothetical protein